LKKYKIGDKIEFIYVFGKIPIRMTGIIEDISETSRLPICVKLDRPFREGVFTTNYVNITLKEIL